MAGSEQDKKTVLKPTSGRQVATARYAAEMAEVDPSPAFDVRREIEQAIGKHGADTVLAWIRMGQRETAVTPPLRQAPYVDNSVFMGDAPEIKLRQWWADTARRDCEQVLPKAIEYSSIDLTTVGAGLPGVQANDQIRTEAGIAFYLLGKVSRLTGAYGEGRVPSDDTWHDVTVYSKMGRFVRQFGSWGVTK